MLVSAAALSWRPSSRPAWVAATGATTQGVAAAVVVPGVGYWVAAAAQGDETD